MLKTTGSSGLASKRFTAKDEVVGSGGNRTNEMIKNLSKFKRSKNDKSKNSIHVSIFRAMREPTFFIPKAKEVFNYLRQAFIEALILQYFDLKNHIQIETDASGYAISGVFSQLSSDWVALDKPHLSKNLVKNLTKSDFSQ